MLRKKTKRMGRGSYSVAKLVLPRTNRPKSKLTGKVIKQLFKPLTAKEGNTLKKQIENYIHHLSEAKIAVLPTKIVLGLTKIPGKYKFTFVQPFVPKEKILFNYLRSCSKQQAIQLFNKAQTIITKIQEYNKTHETKIGLDILIKNLAVIDGEITLIDFYPPYILKNYVIPTNVNSSSQKRNFLKRFVYAKINNPAPIYANRLTEKTTPSYLTSRTLKDFLKARPELNKEFNEILLKN